MDPLISSAICDITEASIDSVRTKMLEVLNQFVRSYSRDKAAFLAVTSARTAQKFAEMEGYVCLRLFRPFVSLCHHSTYTGKSRAVPEGRLLTLSGQILEMISDEVDSRFSRFLLTVLCDQIGQLDPHLRCTIRNTVVSGSSLGLGSPVASHALPAIHEMTQQVHIFVFSSCRVQHVSDISRGEGL